MESKKRHGDRFDAKMLRGLDSLHVFMPYLYPNRADNEAFIYETVELGNLNEYLKKKNDETSNGKYTVFHAIIAAVVKTITQRPKMNCFIKNNRLYMRDKLSCAFVVKRKFEDTAHEALAYMEFDENSTMDSVHDRIMSEINFCRGDAKDNSSKYMDLLGKLPRPILGFLMSILHFLDNKGKLPRDLIKTDPNHATVFLTNLGSIGLKAGYHHLSNWGTTSVFIVVGKIRTERYIDESGAINSREVVDIGVTLDERIADGYYYSKTIQLLKKLISNPELLDKPAKELVTL